VTDGIFDARTKLLCFLLFVTAVIEAGTLLPFLVLVVLLFPASRSAGLCAHDFFRPLASLWQFFLLVWLMNAFFSTDARPLWHWWIFNLTEEGTIQGLLVVLRVLLIVEAGAIYTASSSTKESVGAINWTLTPLSLFRVPVGEISLIIGSALQFVPMLQEETERIKKAQKARGAVFGGKNLIKRAKSMIPLLLPVFLRAFSHADALATAMEARGYQSGGRRTKRKHPPFSLCDKLALSGGMILVVFCYLA